MGKERENQMTETVREILGEKGRGVIGTSNAGGEVNLAIYAPPRILDDETLVFGMTEGKTHDNLLENPHASYLFMISGEGYRGIRLQLALIEIPGSGEILEKMRKKLSPLCGDKSAGKLKYAARFRIEGQKALV